MKTKIVGVVITCLIGDCLVGCGKRSYFMDTQEYNKVHIDTTNYVGCLELDKYYMGNTGVEVITPGNGAMWLSEGTYILIEGDECPICKVIEENKSLSNLGIK